MANAYRDDNDVPTLIAASNVDGKTPIRLYADPVTHRLLVDTSSSNPGYQTPTSGSLNQGTFTWATAPNVIVTDGVPKQKVSTDGTVNWTGTTTTVLTIWPTSDIFAAA